MAEDNGQVLDTKQQTDDAQVLDGEKQTDPQTGEDEIDVTKNLGKKFVMNPKRPDLTMTGEELRTAVGRAKLADKTQSELHQAQERLKELEAKNAQIEQENQLLKVIRASRSSVQEESEESEDVFNFDETTPKIDPRVVRQTIEPEIKRTDSEISELKKQIQDLTQREQQREQTSAYRQFGEQVRTAEEIALRKEFPDLTQAELREMVGNKDAIRNLTTAALIASNEGNYDLAWEKEIEARDRQENLTNLRLQATIKQQRANEKKSAKERLETKSTTDIKVPDVLTKMAKNPKDAKAKEEALDNILLEKSKSRSLLRKVVG